MAITLEEARAFLAEETALLLAGEATGGAVGTIVDVDGLEHITEDNALNGCLAYIREDAAGGGAAPEGESRRITDFDEGTSTITVEYNWTAAVGAGDLYEVYLARLTLAQWDEAINLAISQAWPQVWARVTWETAASGVDTYLLPAAAHDVLAVTVVPVGALLGWPAQTIPRTGWYVDGTPGTDVRLHLLRPVPATARQLHITYKARYDELEAADETDLDRAYLMAAGKANLYATLADEAGGQADASRYLSLMKHWQEIAKTRAAELEAMLLGALRTAGEKK